MIDPRAVIDPGAELADDVSVGPYAVIGADVVIGPGCIIGPHVVIQGPTSIGANNHIYQFASIGDAPQDKKYQGEPTRLEIGNGNTIREYVTINRGTVQDNGVTRVGDDNWIMAYCHIAHDCVVGSHTIFANNASLAGHVHIHDHVILGGYTLVYQFCSIGAHALTAYSSGVSLDIPPYVTVGGSPARPHGLNMEGLRRRGFPEQTRNTLKQAYRILYRQNLSLEDARQRLQELQADCPEVGLLTEFLANRRRGIVR